MATIWGGAQFDPDADLKPQIINALAGANPQAKLSELWPWVPSQARLQLVARAKWASTPGEAEVLVARYEHTIRAHWREMQPSDRAWWQRWRKKGNK